eukprot:388336_1
MALFRKFKGKDSDSETETDIRRTQTSVVPKSNHTPPISHPNDLLQKLGKVPLSIENHLDSKRSKEAAIHQRKEDRRVLNEGGNFEVQVHIQELRDLVGLDQGGSSDPIVTVTIMDQKKSTKKIEDKTNITLNQDIFFSLKALEPRQLPRTKCVIEVFDHNSVFPNKLIGAFTFNLGSIYYRKHHEIYNQWVALSNYEISEQHNYDTEDSDAKYSDDDHQEKHQDRVRVHGIQGSLKLSIRVLGANDEPYTHGDDEDIGTYVGDNGLVLLPPSITQKPYKLTVRIHEYKHFPRLDEDPMAFLQRFQHNYSYYKDKKVKNNKFLNGLRALGPDAWSSKEEREKKKQRRLDPFFVVDFAGMRVNSIDSRWEVNNGKGCDGKVYIQFELPVMEPTHCEYIDIEFRDKDITDNDLIGIIRMNYHQTKQQQVKPRWYHIYGAPVGDEINPYAIKMNRGVLPGTYFRGQCLMDVELTKQPRPPSINCAHFGGRNNDDPTNYELTCDIYCGTEMYDASDDMFIEVSIGNSRERVKCTQRESYQQDDDSKPSCGHIDIFHKEEKKRESWTIYKRVTLQVLMKDIANDTTWGQNMLDRFIFVYLCVGKPKDEQPERIAYHRIPLKDIFKHTPKDPPQWYDMREDMVWDKYPDGVFPGSLLMTLYCKKQSQKYKVALPNLDDQRTKLKKKPKMCLRCDVFLGRHLASSDLFSPCDAYLQVRFCGKSAKTKVCMDRPDPQWFQTLFIEDIQVPDLEYAPAIYCEILDHNDNEKDTPIGRFKQVPIEVCIDRGGKHKEKKEYPLKSPENDDDVEGTVIAQFQLSNDKQKIEEDPPILTGIDSIETEPYSVHIVVLGLRDVSSLLGVHECCVVFELGGKKYTSRKSEDPEPRNPNFCQIIHFDVELPEDDTFLPNFNISVVDSVFGGLIERTIGYASKPVSELKAMEQQRNQQRNQFLEEQKTMRKYVQDKTLMAQGNVQDQEEVKLEMPEDDEKETLLSQTQQHIAMSETEKKEEEKEKKKEDPSAEFVYFDEPKSQDKLEELMQSTSIEPKMQKYMRTKDGDRDTYDDELEDELRKQKLGNYTLKPFVNIPLYSVGKNKRNIGTFKGLVSFEPKQPRLIEIDVYEWKDLQLPIANDSLKPWVVVTFGKTELTSSWSAQQNDADRVRVIKRTFQIPVIGPVFAENDEVRIAVWNETPRKKDKDYVIGSGSYKYSPDATLDGWISLKNARHQNVGKVLVQMKVTETTKVRKARVLRMKDSKYKNIQKSKSYQQEIKEMKLDTHMRGVENDIGMQYIREITKPQQLYLRVYVLNGIDMTPPDGGNKLNDPYLTVTIGDQSQTTKPEDTFALKKDTFTLKRDVLPHYENDVSPDFYESFEFLIEMPGPATLTIECWDNVIFGIKDSLIGSTRIDIEDRWYDPYWREYVKPKPIETRTIKLHQMPHGKLKLWMELLTVQQRNKHPNLIDISQPENDPYELRVIIWECNDIPVQDQEGMNDLFCKASFDDGSHERKTDLHFRSQAAWTLNPCDKDGNTTDGSFNWRMKFPIHSLRKARKALQHVQIEVWDEDYFSSNEYIGCVRVPLRPFLDVCLSKATKNRCIWRKNDETKLKYTFEKWKTDGSLVETGTLLVTLELVPYKLIDIYPAGNGREAPNTNPHLPDPKGRIKLSLWHPWRSVRLLLGDRLCCKLSVVLLIAIIITAIIQFFPQLFTEFAVTTVMSSRRISSNLIWGN